MRQKNWGVGRAPRATRRSSHQTLFFLYVRVQRFESLETLALCREFAAFSARLQALGKERGFVAPQKSGPRNSGKMASEVPSLGLKQGG